MENNIESIGKDLAFLSDRTYSSELMLGNCGPWFYKNKEYCVIHWHTVEDISIPSLGEIYATENNTPFNYKYNYKYEAFKSFFNYLPGCSFENLFCEGTRCKKISNKFALIYLKTKTKHCRPEEIIVWQIISTSILSKLIAETKRR